MNQQDSDILNFLKEKNYRHRTGKIAKKFGVTIDSVLSSLRRLQKKGLVVKDQISPSFNGSPEATWYFYDAKKWG